jgi:hypothetical protein
MKNNYASQNSCRVKSWLVCFIAGALGLSLLTPLARTAEGWATVRRLFIIT